AQSTGVPTDLPPFRWLSGSSYYRPPPSGRSQTLLTATGRVVTCGACVVGSGGRVVGSGARVVGCGSLPALGISQREELLRLYGRRFTVLQGVHGFKTVARD